MCFKKVMSILLMDVTHVNFSNPWKNFDLRLMSNFFKKSVP